MVFHAALPTSSMPNKNSKCSQAVQEQCLRTRVDGAIVTYAVTFLPPARCQRENGRSRGVEHRMRSEGLSSAEESVIASGCDDRAHHGRHHVMSLARSRSPTRTLKTVQQTHCLPTVPRTHANQDPFTTHDHEYLEDCNNSFHAMCSLRTTRPIGALAGFGSCPQAANGSCFWPKPREASQVLQIWLSRWCHARPGATRPFRVPTPSECPVLIDERSSSCFRTYVGLLSVGASSCNDAITCAIRVIAACT